MKTITLLVLPVILLLSFASSAGVNAEGEKFSAPIGEWVNEVIQSDGDLINTRLTITPDHKFTGVKYINGKHNWSYGGTWSMSGREFTWVYEQSSIPSLVGYVDVDVVLQVDKLVLKMRAVNDEVYTFIRVR